MTERRHDFDWIKTIVIINLFPFHVIWLMTFVSGFSQTDTNSIISTILQAYVVEVGPWHMPLLFLIAGYSAAISLSRRSLYDYSWERFRRLFVPLVFYWLIIRVVINCFLPDHNGRRSPNYFVFDFLPYHWKITFDCNWHHFWFIFYLLLINLSILPLLLRFSHQKIQMITIRINSHMVWLPMVIFGSIMATLGRYWPLFINCSNLTNDWSYLACNTFAFIIGYLLFIDPRLMTTIYSNFRWWLLLFLCSSITRIVFIAQYQHSFYTTPEMTQYLFNSALTGVHTWSAMALFLTLAHRYLATTNNFLLRYMKKASLPFYIFHYPIAIVVGSYVTRIGLKSLSEFFLLTILTTILTILVYELLVKPWSFSQFLLGVK